MFCWGFLVGQDLSSLRCDSSLIFRRGISIRRKLMYYVTSVAPHNLVPLGSLLSHLKLSTAPVPCSDHTPLSPSHACRFCKYLSTLGKNALLLHHLSTPPTLSQNHTSSKQNKTKNSSFPHSSLSGPWSSLISMSYYRAQGPLFNGYLGCIFEQFGKCSFKCAHVLYSGSFWGTLEQIWGVIVFISEGLRGKWRKKNIYSGSGCTWSS